MPKRPTRDLVEIAEDAIRSFEWGQYAPGLEQALADDPESCTWVNELARRIAEAVR